jgi:hypothetical protein
MEEEQTTEEREGNGGDLTQPSGGFPFVSWSHTDGTLQVSCAELALRVILRSTVFWNLTSCSPV